MGELEQLLSPLSKLHDIATHLHHLCEVFAPASKEVVGSPYVARRLACTTEYVSQMAREGTVPATCIVPGTGNGKLWKFYRKPIDEWIASR